MAGEQGIGACHPEGRAGGEQQVRFNKQERLGEKGFTLLEVLLAMTILSLIAVIIGVSLRLGIRAWERGESDSDDSQKLRYVVERLSQEIRSVYPYQMLIDGEKAIAFKGKSDSIFFVTSSVKIFRRRFEMDFLFCGGQQPNDAGRDASR